MSYWIAFTLMAVIMQAVRTAAQKDLSGALTPMATTLTRYLYGLPFVVLYLVILLTVSPQWRSSLSPELIHNTDFILFASIAAVMQILATACMVKMFTLKNFAVATSFAKTEAIQVALFASLFFADYLSATGWLSVIIGVAGVILMSGMTLTTGQNSRSAATTFQPATIMYGLLSGGLFAWTSLCLREASLTLQQPLILSAAITLLFMVVLQTLICIIYVSIKEAHQWQVLFKLKKAGLFVGATSALGSVGWFTAMSMQNPALVKTLGQVEFFITLAITHFYFKEKMQKNEVYGMVCIVASILLLLTL